MSSRSTKYVLPVALIAIAAFFVILTNEVRVRVAVDKDRSSKDVYIVKVYEQRGFVTEGEFLRARFRVVGNPDKELRAAGWQEWYSQDGVLMRKQHIEGARLVKGEFVPPGQFGEPKSYFESPESARSRQGLSEDDFYQFRLKLFDLRIEEYRRNGVHDAEKWQMVDSPIGPLDRVEIVRQ